MWFCFVSEKHEHFFTPAKLWRFKFCNISSDSETAYFGKAEKKKKRGEVDQANTSRKCKEAYFTPTFPCEKSKTGLCLLCKNYGSWEKLERGTSAALYVGVNLRITGRNTAWKQVSDVVFSSGRSFVKPEEIKVTSAWQLQIFNTKSMWQTGSLKFEKWASQLENSWMRQKCITVWLMVYYCHSGTK